jgi:hypothetical protein
MFNKIAMWTQKKDSRGRSNGSKAQFAISATALATAVTAIAVAVIKDK